MPKNSDDEPDHRFYTKNAFYKYFVPNYDLAMALLTVLFTIIVSYYFLD